MKKHFPLPLGIIFILAFAYVIYSANRGELPHFIRQLYMFKHGDKLGHVLVMGTLSFVVNLFLFPRKIIFLKKSILLGTVIVFCLISLEEFSQIFISNRSFDLMDLCCSYLGVMCGHLAIILTTKQPSGRTK